ncbi:MAG: hypothetical protein Q8P19_02340 [bacterium]|nr:hypothetical protein [bacterium]
MMRGGTNQVVGRNKEAVEERARRILKRRKIQDAVVTGLYVGSVLTTALVAPNAARLFRYVEPYIGMRNTRGRMSQAVSRLIARGMLKRNGYGKSARLTLTARGKNYAESLMDDLSTSVTIPRHWDRRWRVVIFDIWEKRRNVRDRLRAMLQRIGFVKIQNSVWTFPYDCEEVVALVRTELRTGNGVMYIVADGMEGDTELREHFGLPSS